MQVLIGRTTSDGCSQSGDTFGEWLGQSAAEMPNSIIASEMEAAFGAPGQCWLKRQKGWEPRPGLQFSGLCIHCHAGAP